MKVSRRPKGIGAILQQSCGELDKNRTKWIDSLSPIKWCTQHNDVHTAKLQELAKSSCGQWCIVDTTITKIISGYELTGKMCWRYFKGNRELCAKWYLKKQKTIWQEI